MEQNKTEEAKDALKIKSKNYNALLVTINKDLLDRFVWRLDQVDTNKVLYKVIQF